MKICSIWLFKITHFNSKSEYLPPHQLVVPHHHFQSEHFIIDGVKREKVFSFETLKYTEMLFGANNKIGLYKKNNDVWFNKIFNRFTIENFIKPKHNSISVNFRKFVHYGFWTKFFRKHWVGRTKKRTWRFRKRHIRRKNGFSIAYICHRRYISRFGINGTRQKFFSRPVYHFVSVRGYFRRFPNERFKSSKFFRHARAHVLRLKKRKIMRRKFKKTHLRTGLTLRLLKAYHKKQWLLFGQLDEFSFNRKTRRLFRKILKRQCYVSKKKNIGRQSPVRRISQKRFDLYRIYRRFINRIKRKKSRRHNKTAKRVLRKSLKKFWICRYKKKRYARYLIKKKFNKKLFLPKTESSRINTNTVTFSIKNNFSLYKPVLAKRKFEYNAFYPLVFNRFVIKKINKIHSKIKKVVKRNKIRFKLRKVLFFKKFKNIRRKNKSSYSVYSKKYRRYVKVPVRYIQRARKIYRKHFYRKFYKNGFKRRKKSSYRFYSLRYQSFKFSCLRSKKINTISCRMNYLILFFAKKINFLSIPWSSRLFFTNLYAKNFF